MDRIVPQRGLPRRVSGRQRRVAAQTKVMARKNPQQYVLKQPVAAVKLHATIHTHGAVTTIAAGSVLTLIGASLLPDMVEVECNGILYAIFDVDLSEKSTSSDRPDSDDAC